MSETANAIIISPGYLTTCEDTLIMEPFKKHPKGLTYYEQRLYQYSAVNAHRVIKLSVEKH